MTTGFLIIAHAPLASALREAVLHVFPEHAHTVAAVDVKAEWTQEQALDVAQQAMKKSEFHAFCRNRKANMGQVNGKPN